MDSTGPLLSGGHWAYRVIGSYQNTRMYIPGNVKLLEVTPELTYKLSATSRFTLKYTYIDWSQPNAPADANAWAWPVNPSVVNGATVSTTPPSGFTYNGRNGDTTWDTRTDRVNIVQGQFTTSLTSAISRRFGAFFANDHMGQDTGFPTFPGTGTQPTQPHFKPAESRRGI